MAESDEEWEEAKQCNARLIELGETPEVEIVQYPVIKDIKEMLQYDCKDSAEALCILPIFFIEAIPGLFVGCALANLLSGYGVYDIVFGSFNAYSRNAYFFNR